MKQYLLLLIGLFPLLGKTQNNWDGDNSVGNLSFCNNWYGDACPSTWNSSTPLNFNYRNNSSQTTLFQDLSWRDVQLINYAATFPTAIPFNGSNGLNFYWKVENSSSFTQTLNLPLSIKGSGFELNAVNGNLDFGGIIYNDNNRVGNIYNSNNKSTILSNYIVGNSSVNLTLQNSGYGILQINCNMPTLSSTSFSGGIKVNRGELWFNNGAAINGGTITLGNSDANVCKLYINAAAGATTVNNAISIPASSTNCFIGNLGTSNTNTFSGNISLNSGVTFEGNGGGTLDLQGIISGSSAVNTGIITGSSGNAVIRYSTNAKTYTGLTTVGASSTLQLSSVNCIPSSNNITINNGGTLRISANQTLTNITINSGGTLTIDAGVTLNLTGTLSGSGTLNNLGTLSLNGSSAQTFPGTINVNNGTANTLTGLTINNSNGVTLNSNIRVSGSLSFTTGKLALNGTTLTLAGTLSGMSANNCITGTNTSSLTISSTSSLGTVFFDQASSADVTVVNGSNALQNLIVSGAGGSVTLGNKLNLFNRLSVSAGTLNTGGFLVLRSISTNTAYVDQVGGTINGQVTVERYFHKNKRGWRMLTAPVSYVGIANGTIDNVFNNWQSNFGYSGNYGTQVNAGIAPTGSNGLDAQTNSATMLRYNSSGAGSWTKIENTKTELIAGSTGNGDNKGYFIFCRGDRTVNPGVNNAWVQTTLASKGLLQTGSQTLTFSGASGNSWLIGNPYAAPVDMSAVTYNNIGNFVYFWDPNLTGITANSPGAYTYFDRSNWSAGPVSGTSTKFFQSGQSFLVKPTSATASIVFAESHKSTSVNNNTQTTGTINGSADLFNVKLFAVQTNGDKTNVDGLRAKFGTYSNDVDDEDCEKVAGSIETIGLVRNSKNLVIEARPYIVDYDSLFLNMKNLIEGSNYEFLIEPVNFDASVIECKLIDNFLQTETNISLTTNNFIPFTVTSVTGSNASNRFTIVFKGAGTLSVNSVVAKAARKANNVDISFTTIDEREIKYFNIEKSTDGRTFNKIAELKPKNNQSENTYLFTDNKPTILNYYRVSIFNSNGTIQYSNVVKIDINSKAENAIKVYPNPAEGNVINLQMNDVAEGKATLNIFNNLGQLVLTQNVNVASSTSTLSVELSKTLTSGAYQITITDAKGILFNETLFKK